MSAGALLLYAGWCLSRKYTSRPSISWLVHPVIFFSPYSLFFGQFHLYACVNVVACTNMCTCECIIKIVINILIIQYLCCMLSLQDRFGVVRYEIIGDDTAPNYFSIDRESGQVKLKKTVKTDTLTEYQVSLY